MYLLQQRLTLFLPMNGTYSSAFQMISFLKQKLPSFPFKCMAFFKGLDCQAESSLKPWFFFNLD